MVKLKNKKFKIGMLFSKLLKSLTLIILLSLGNSSKTCAQNINQVVEDIYYAYDILPYITFDVKFVYTSDTLDNDFMYDELSGQYTLAGKKAKFKLGNMEFMQNDSMLISVNNDERFILVANARSDNFSSELPMRASIDSMLQNYQEHYSVSYTVTGDTGIVSFEHTDSLAQYLNFTIAYDTANNLLHHIQYTFLEQTVTVLDESEEIVIREKKLTLSFFNYRFDNIDAGLYDENQYIYMEQGVYQPTELFKNYRVFNSYHHKAIAPIN